MVTMKGILWVIAMLFLSGISMVQAANYFYVSKSVPLTYDATVTDGVLDPGTEKLIQNEALQVFVCQLKSSSNKENAPFGFDQAGQLILDRNRITAWRWAELGVSSGNDTSYVPIGTTVGFPSCGTTTRHYRFSAQAPSTESFYDCDGNAVEVGIQKTIYYYLVMTDRRRINLVDGETTEEAVLPTAEHAAVSAYAIAYANSETFGMTSNFACTINHADTTNVRGSKQVTLTMIPAAKVTTWASVDTKGMTEVEAQEAIDAYFSPRVSALTADVEGNLTLTASTTEDVMTYRLETTTDITDPEAWIPVDTWIKKLSDDEKNTLDNHLLKSYNRLRIGQGSGVPLPRLSEETGRFYRLIGE